MATKGKDLAPAAPDERDAEIAALKERVRRLEKVNEALIDRAERSSDMEGSYSMFETAIALEAMVRDRTGELEDALGKLAEVNAYLETVSRDADAARARLRDAIESLSDGFALFDAEDRLVTHNKAFLKIWPEFADIAEASPTFTDLAEQLARGGRTMGSRLSPDRWMRERMARYRDASGAHVQLLSDGRWLQINELRTSEGGTVGIYTDITSVKAEDARERARELAERNLALQASLDTLSEGACLFDSQHRLVAWNEPLIRMLGIESDLDGAIGRHERLNDWCVNECGLDMPHAVEWRSGKGPRISTDCTLKGRNFVIRSVSLSAGGMAYAFDDVTDRIRFQRSMTEQAETLEKRVQERTAELIEVNRQLVEAKNEAEQANRSKTSFIAAASHDLLQPLNAARLFVSALAERRLAATNRGLVRQSAVALDSVEELLEALFEISRLDAGAIQPEIAALPLDRILSALRIEFAPLARKDGLTFEIPETGFWVKSDLRLLRRILQNFVSNAIRYTEKGGVEVQAREEGDHIAISVTDTGPGIDPEKREAIFEEFRRLKKTQKTPGKGLGLAIVRRASAMLGHEIDLQSEEGRGSTFTILVPRAEPRVTEAATTTAGERIGRSGEGTVTVVDKDEQVQQGMRVLLENWGLKVVTGGHPDDPAVVKSVKQGTGLLIADYHLDDGMTGDEAVAMLREKHAGDLPAVIITADRSDEVKLKLGSQGLPILTKPVKPAQLRALLRQLAITG
ncbi:NahK/ErcS family hybrid sensor histidine kinase/response regulator [Croceicoccus gelatinilyticus]|uniref:hybrid sensor histidine kinase/response regulator n=1 Tax=Croceicoccus gelatinilyticus TaxID=2835536 RepID=UPI001BCC8DF5|nr:NahK/ErcS family hybrid sensor histidine kinase/response regulator [Croceicoccus gelatinilyticus]MBS7669973.1 PAS-domain containing protein [Croceicoccus gelatinilyticus]